MNVRLAIRRTVVAALLVAACAQSAPTLASADTPPNTTTPTTESGSGPMTWSLKPATADGPDSRANFAYDVVPGQSIADYVAVTNFSDQPLQLRLYASDAFTTEDGGFDLLAASDEPIDVGVWIRLDAPVVQLEPRETRVITLHISVPQNATPGDHAGGIVAALSTTTADAAGNRVVVEHRVGARVYLTIGGPLTPALELVDVTMNHDGTLNPLGTGHIDVHYTVRNVGNVRLAARQTLTVTGPRGVVLARSTLGDLPELLPGSSVEEVARIDGVEPAARLRTTLRLEPYTPQQLVTVQPVEQTKSLWAVPWTQAAIGTLLATAIVWRGRSRRRKKVVATPDSTSSLYAGTSRTRCLRLGDAEPHRDHEAAHNRPLICCRWCRIVVS